MPKIVVLLECVGDPLPRFEAALDAAGIDGASVEVVADAGVRSPEDLHAAVAGASALLTPLTIAVDAALLDAAGPGLRVVANYAVGFDNIDVVRNIVEDDIYWKQGIWTALEVYPWVQAF